MDTFLIILALLLSAAGFAGCFLPAVPGPPLNYLALLLFHWVAGTVSTLLLVVFAIITVLVLLFDYWLPIWMGKKFGASKQGITGSIIGMVAGLFFTPVGMIAGIIIGSIVGDLVANRSMKQAGKAAAGNLFGTLLTIGMKLIVSAAMFFYLVVKLVAFLSL